MNFRDPGFSFREPGLSLKDRVKSFVTLCFTNNQDQFDDSGLAEDIDMLVDEVRFQALAAPLNTKSDTGEPAKSLLLIHQPRKNYPALRHGSTPTAPKP